MSTGIRTNYKEHMTSTSTVSTAAVSTTPTEAATRAQAEQQLYKATGFALFECKKALFQTEGDVTFAKHLLASGAWRLGKSVSWNHAGLAIGAEQLKQKTGFSLDVCREMVMNAGGNVDLAIEHLEYTGQLKPVVTPSNTPTSPCRIQNGEACGCGFGQCACGLIF